MKGSDKWGQGRGPRVEVVLALLVALTAIGVYAYYVESSGLVSGQSGRVTAVTTTGLSCTDSSLPEAVQTVEQDPRFTDLSGGLCYNYMGEVPAGALDVLTFNYYNGTIAYPCGTEPTEPPASQIKANLSASTGNVTAVAMTDASSLNPPRDCPPGVVPVTVVSVVDVESTIPAVPQLNVTLAASAEQSTPIVGLSATLSFGGYSQVFQLVSRPSTLAPGAAVSKTEIILSGVTLSSGSVYPMTISGTFEGGAGFSYLVHVQIAQVP